MSHIFLSYSRKDIEFSGKIVHALAENSLDTWIDWKGIPKGENWEQEIYRGIEEADAFIFLISPDSAISEICTKEILHAANNNKRILPILIRDTDVKLLHSEISKRNWIFCRDKDNFNESISQIFETIHVDYEWLIYHTRLQVKALDWGQNKDASRLLRGRELRDAEERLSAIGFSVDPQPTELQRSFILASQRNEVSQRRRITVGLGVGVLLLAFLAIFALIQRNVALATEQRFTDLTNQLTELSSQLTQISQPTRSSNNNVTPTLQPITDTGDKSEPTVQFPTILVLVVGLVIATGGATYTVFNMRNRTKKSRELEIANPKKNIKVFLCHSSKDKPKVRQYHERLKTEKWINPWLDVEQILPGMDWDKEIRSAVKSSDVVLVFLSNFSIGIEGYVQKEIKQALDVADEKPDGTIFIIPLRLEDCEVPDRLTQWQWLNLYEDDSYGRLIKALKIRANDLTTKNTGVK